MYARNQSQYSFHAIPVRSHHRCLSILYLSAQCISTSTTKSPYDETILSLGLTCIATENIQLKELSFVLTTNRDLAWNDLPGWRAVDVDKLEKLGVVISFGSDPAGHVQPSPGSDRRFMLQTMPAIVGMINRTASTLQDLEITYDDFIFGPQLESLPVMPQLSRLSLNSITIDGHSFNVFLSKAPNLKDLKLTETRARGGSGFQNWRPFFDALRRHYGRGQGKRLRIEYEIMLDWHNRGTVTFDHTIPDAAYKYDGWWGDQPEQGDIVEMLSNYVSGLGEWRVDPGWRRYTRMF